MHKLQATSMHFITIKYSTMPVYKVYKTRIVLSLLTFIFSLSLLSAFLFNANVVEEGSNDVPAQLNFRLFGKIEQAENDIQGEENDYGEYGPADIMVSDIGKDYDSDSDVLNENNVFKAGDFDLVLPNATIENNSTQKQHRVVERKLKNNNRKIELAGFGRKADECQSYVEENVYWAECLENKMPKGTSDISVGEYLHSIHNKKVIRVQPPSWDRCGRPKNQYLTLENGLHVCARYRDPHNYLVLGEVLSFYLSRLLGLHNTPIVTLSRVTSDSPQWSAPSVKHNVKLAGWKMNTTVALIQWIDGVERSRIPPMVLIALTKYKTIDGETIGKENLTDNQVIELMQWTDLIVFDYITGHYDRVASMQDAAEKEHRQSILEDTVHNLVKSQRDRSLWLIDNESGMLDGYALMYSSGTVSANHNKPLDDDSGSHFIHFHEQMLNSICLFRRSTVVRITLLHRQENPLNTLLNIVNKYELHFQPFTRDIISNEQLVKRFKQRIKNVYLRMKHCGVS